jgi:hypothetical protein
MSELRILRAFVFVARLTNAGRAPVFGKTGLLGYPTRAPRIIQCLAMFDKYADLPRWSTGSSVDKNKCCN